MWESTCELSVLGKSESESPHICGVRALYDRNSFLIQGRRAASPRATPLFEYSVQRSRCSLPSEGSAEHYAIQSLWLCRPSSRVVRALSRKKATRQLALWRRHQYPEKQQSNNDCDILVKVRVPTPTTLSRRSPSAGIWVWVIPWG